MKTDSHSLSYLKWFSVPVLVFLAAAIPLNLFFEPISGDLTRIGHWAERDFGWNQAQPSVSVRANGTMVEKPRVVVLGDSFSHSNVWQSYLADARHLEILSYQYRDVGCVDNWVQWVKERQLPSVNTVVIEAAERSFMALFRNRNICTKREPLSHDVAATTLKPNRQQYGLTLDAAYFVPTLGNSVRAGLQTGRIDSAGVVNVPLTADRLFSNRKANRLLYYSEDDLKVGWTEEDMVAAMQNLRHIQEELAASGLRFLLVVVPDKSTVYRHFIADGTSKARYPDVFARLKAAQVNSVDLLEQFRKEASKTIDLYLPNDTHLSTQGYRLMATKVADEAF
jgi:hypothetical protein